MKIKVIITTEETNATFEIEASKERLGDLRANIEQMTLSTLNAVKVFDELKPAYDAIANGESYAGEFVTVTE